MKQNAFDLMCITFEQKGKNAFKSGKQKWGNMNQSS